LPFGAAAGVVGGAASTGASTTASSSASTVTVDPSAGRWRWGYCPGRGARASRFSRATSRFSSSSRAILR
jgi:hypothetical protein